MHYHKLIIALTETNRIMKKIDKIEIELIMESILNQLHIKQPEFKDGLNSLPDQIKKKIVNKLTKEKNETTFISTLAEIDFGLLFNKLGFDLEYEKPYDNKQTPDWTLSIGDSKAICEVYRLGKSKEDEQISDFEKQIIKKVRELEFNYFVKFKFENQYFDISMYDINSIVSDLNKWFLSSSKSVGEKTVIMDNFCFEVSKINTKKNHLSCHGSLRQIDIKRNKIIQSEYQDENKITKKLKIYKDLISQTNYPYFIGIYLDFACGLCYEDFEEYFLGKVVGFDCEVDPDYEASLEDRDYGTEWTELGIFYKNPQLSGLIIYDKSKYNLLLNPLKNQVIYKDDNLLILNNLKKHV